MEVTLGEIADLYGNNQFFNYDRIEKEVNAIQREFNKTVGEAHKRETKPGNRDFSQTVKQ
jgi:hypothetical protein